MHCVHRSTMIHLSCQTNYNRLCSISMARKQNKQTMDIQEPLSTLLPPLYTSLHVNQNVKCVLFKPVTIITSHGFMNPSVILLFLNLSLTDFYYNQKVVMIQHINRTTVLEIIHICEKKNIKVIFQFLCLNWLN